MQGLKSKDLKKKEKQNWMKWKLSSVMPREDSLGFPSGDQVSNGHDMYYVHMLSREGMGGNMGTIHIESKRCVQAALHTSKMYNSGANVPSGCLVQKAQSRQ